MMKPYLLSILLISIAQISFSNNITISNVTIASRNTVDDYIMVQFDLAWDNSWRSGTLKNWDAAWIFIKYRVKGQTDWAHASLNWAGGNGVADGHIVPAGSVITSSKESGAYSLGVFIYSSNTKAQSSASYPGVQLRWKYGTDGVQDDDLLEITVFGIEMVYLPQGSFEVGNINSANSSFYEFPNDVSAYTIGSEGAITVSNSNGSLYYDNNEGGAGDQTGTIPGAFPKGYQSFYCMKYEISQEQYVEFLAKLTSTQASSRDLPGGSNRNGITGNFGTFSTSHPYVACNFLSWADLAAYLDWAALRPMTELEFEKACRGTLPSINGELVWGIPSDAAVLLSMDDYTLSNSGTENEAIASNYNLALGNVMHAHTKGVIDGPLRVGIFAANPNNIGRLTAGASYYGVMELSGNVWEQTVSVGDPAGRAFSPLNGDGALTAAGDHDVLTWPATDAVGMGKRGGDWNTHVALLGGQRIRTGNRAEANVGASTRTAYTGGRGGRTAP